MKFEHRSAGGWRDPQQHDDVMKSTKIVKDLVVEDRTLHKYEHRRWAFSTSVCARGGVQRL